MSRLLTLQDDNDDLKFVGNAFPIDPVPQNIALLTMYFLEAFDAYMLMFRT